MDASRTLWRISCARDWPARRASAAGNSTRPTTRIRLLPGHGDDAHLLADQDRRRDTFVAGGRPRASADRIVRPDALLPRSDVGDGDLEIRGAGTGPLRSGAGRAPRLHRRVRQRAARDRPHLGVAGVAVAQESYAAATPAIDGGKLYVGHFGGAVIAIDLAARRSSGNTALPGGRTGTAVLCLLRGDGGARVIGGRDGKVPASTARRAGQPGSSRRGRRRRIAGRRRGTRLRPSKDGTLYVLDLKDGHRVWQYVTGAPIAHARDRRREAHRGRRGWEPLLFGTKGKP